MRLHLKKNLYGEYIQINSAKVGNKHYNETYQYMVAVFNLTKETLVKIDYNSYIIKTTIKEKMVLA